MGKTSVEQRKGKYLVVNQLTYPEAINERELQGIARGLVESLIPVHTEKNKKGFVLKSSIEGMISLQSYFSAVVSKSMFLDVIVQMAAIVKECEKNLMNVNNLMLDDQYIFLEPRTQNVKCIFWPIVNNQNGYTLSEFFQDLPSRTVFTKQEDHEYITNYLDYFKNHTPFSINGFEKYIFELIGKTVENKTHIPSGSIRVGDTSRFSKKAEEVKGNLSNIAYNPLNKSKVFEEPAFPYLIREKTQEKISVNKPDFRIGKKSSYCDYLVSNNNAVSRNHADIITRNRRYYIIDNNSTNKTYVDGRAIPVQKEIEIFSGTKLRLANEDFVFYI